MSTNGNSYIEWKPQLYEWKPQLYVSLGPHDAYFRMRTLKPQVAKVSTVASVMRDK